MMSNKKDYIGRMMAGREGMIDVSRQCVVGIRPVDTSDRIRSGAHILKIGDKPSMANDQGYVSSVAWSPMLNMWIGLALVANGRARHGEIVRVWDGLRGSDVAGELCDPMHFDKENKRLHA
jgi:sarcosine oxidase subunit alpha